MNDKINNCLKLIDKIDNLSPDKEFNTEFFNLLSNLVLDMELDDTVTVYVFAYNFYLKNHIFPSNSDNTTDIVNNFIEKIENSEVNEYLLLVLNGIYLNDITYFKKAISLNSEYSIAYIYAFFHYVELLTANTNDDGKIAVKIYKYWVALNINWQSFILQNDNDNFDVYNFVPYIKNDTCYNRLDSNLRKSYSFNISVSNLRYTIVLAKRIVELDTANKELFTTNNSLEIEKQRKSDLIRSNVHSWKHIVFPTVLFDLATTLNENNDVENATTLFEVHNSQMMLVHNLELLDLRYNTNDVEFRKKIRSSICSEKLSRAINIISIFNNALNLVLNKLLLERIYSDGDNYFNKEHREILKEKYISKLKNNDNDNATITWFSNEIYPINIKDNWNDVFVDRNGFAYVQLIDIFINLIYNAINYGIKNKNGSINLTFEQNDDYCIFKMSNPIDKDTAFLKSQKVGINSIKSVLSQFNSDENDVVLFNEAQDIFEITLKFESQMMIRKRR